MRARGQYLFDREGNRYLDLLSGFGVFALGRSHPGVIEALRDALELELPSLVQMDVSLLSGILAERLLEKLPASVERVFFCNSGAEAVEAAIKFARAATGRSRPASPAATGWRGTTSARSRRRSARVTWPRSWSSRSRATACTSATTPTCPRKALSGGFVPVGAVAASGRVFERVFDRLDRAVVHGSTYAKGTLAMAAGLATLDALDAEGLVERAAAATSSAARRAPWSGSCRRAAARRGIARARSARSGDSARGPRPSQNSISSSSVPSGSWKST